MIHISLLHITMMITLSFWVGHLWVPFLQAQETTPTPLNCEPSTEPPSTSTSALCLSENIDQHLRCLIDRHKLTGDPRIGRNLPNIHDSKLAQLGRMLFFTTDLGGNNDTACVSCHHPALGGGDRLSLSIGAEAADPRLLGPGRKLRADSTFNIRDENGNIIDPGPTEPRNAPTTFNIGLLDRGLFWDNRIESPARPALQNGAGGCPIMTPDGSTGITPDNMISVTGGVNAANLPAAQVQFPVTSPVEMKGKEFEDIANHDGVFNSNSRNAARASLVNRMKSTPPENGTPSWASLFQEAGLQEDFTFTDIGNAIGEYERSQVFVDNPWKRYVENELDALTTEAKRGAILFLTPHDEKVSTQRTGAGCVGCHTGDNFTDEKFHVIATPQIGRGGSRDEGTGDKNDIGRFFLPRVQDEGAKFAFRTSPLLNIEVTAPYGHAGSYTTLEGIIRHYGNPAKAVREYDYSQLEDIPTPQTARMRENTQPALDVLSQLVRPAGTPEDFEFTDDEVAQLKAFLVSLTDPHVKDHAYLSQWIPDERSSFPGKLIPYDRFMDTQFTAFLNGNGVPSSAIRFTLNRYSLIPVTILALVINKLTRF